METEEITIERGIHGDWKCSSIVNGHLRRSSYYGYSKKEALQEFKRLMEEEDQW